MLYMRHSCASDHISIRGEQYLRVSHRHLVYSADGHARVNATGLSIQPGLIRHGTDNRLIAPTAQARGEDVAAVLRPGTNPSFSQLCKSVAQRQPRIMFKTTSLSEPVRSLCLKISLRGSEKHQEGGAGVHHAERWIGCGSEMFLMQNLAVYGQEGNTKLLQALHRNDH